MFASFRIFCYLGLCFGVLSCWPLSVEQTSTPRSSSPSIQRWSQRSQAILGGKPDLSHPAIGALTFLDSPFCTATLITPRVLLTAAHCADFAQIALYANFGVSWEDVAFRIDLPSQDPKGFTSHRFVFAPEKIFWPTEWFSFGGNYPYDIALIILLEKVPESIAKPIPYNTSPLSNDDIGKEALFLGYGMTQTVPLGLSAVTKQSAKIAITKLSGAELTFGPQKDLVSVCFGDSGGPALFDYSGELRVIAVNSHLSESSSIPGSGGQIFACDGGSVSVRTDAHIEFIQKILTEYGEGNTTCKKTIDCGFCGTCNAQQKCQPKDIEQFTSTCKPCQSNADCGLGVCRLLPEGFRCIQPCELGRCCPKDSFCTPVAPGSSSKLCQPQTGSCPAVSCKEDKECGRAGQCIQNTCQLRPPVRHSLLCRSCQTHADCGDPNNLCYHNGGNTGLCLQACAEGEACPASFRCQVLYAGFPKQCLPKHGSTCTIPCQVDKDCPSSWRCQEQTCLPTQPGQEGDSCDTKTPCDRAFQCIRTLQGQRCLRPCGTPRGLAGSPCENGDTCKDKATCHNDENSSVCLNSCQKDEDCKSSGGGQCYKGFCMCNEDKSCETGHICNRSTGLLGACSPQTQPSECPDSRGCLYYSGGRFCLPTQTAPRNIGSRCDAFAPCALGLQCMPTEGGAICVEDCSTTKTCQRGGSCQSIRGVSLCICTSDSCPSGHTCTITFSRSRGFCKLTDLADCSTDSDCPSSFQCREKRCQLPSPEKPPESVEEPAEITVEPSSPEPPAPEPTTDTTDAGSQTPESNKTVEGTVDTTPEIPPPPKGCGCQEHSSPFPPHWMLVFLLFLWLPGLRRRP